MKLRIIPGNSKIGYVPSVSMLPVRDCREGVPCAKDCYAIRLMKLRPSVLRSWKANSDLWRSEPETFERELLEFLKIYKPIFFRWFVGGDIPDQRFLDMMENVASCNKDTIFLAYTKQHLNFPPKPMQSTKFIYSRYLEESEALPKNISRWSVVLPGGVIATDSFLCPGSCPECRYKCWKSNENITFPLKR